MNAPHTCPKCGATLAPDAPEGLCPACLMLGGLPTDATIKLTPSQMRAPSHGPAAPPPEELAPFFPQLEIIELLGRGGMGAVYKARQPKLNRFVALKIISGDAAADPHFAERFQREAQALAKLNHPNIVSVFDFGAARSGDTPVASSVADGDKSVAAPGIYYFLMEFVDGANLRALMQSGEMKPEAALALIPAFCDALQYAHDEGVVHRDIKPENVLVDKKGRVKIADFGLAKLTGNDAHDHTLTRTGMYLGTPRYMAPEQVEKPETVDHRADIYSLGVVFYEMLTGELPMGRFDPPSKKVQVDVKLDDIVLRSLEKDVDRRYQHASEIKTAVQSVAGKPTPPPVAEPVADIQHASRLGEIVMLALVFLCSISAVLAIKELVAVIVLAVQQKTPGVPVLEMTGRMFAACFTLSLSFTTLIMLNKAKREGQARIARVAALFLAAAWLPALWTHELAWVGSAVALVVWHLLGKPDVQESFRALAAPVEKRFEAAPGLMIPVATPENPRLSRMALIGAIWALFGLIAVIPSVLFTKMVDLAEGRPSSLVYEQPPVAFTIFMGVLLFIGMGAPIGTTILGAISMGSIKRSGGKLYGLPLAFADTVFFPMLLLHGAMAVMLGVLVLSLLKMTGANAGLGALEMALLAMLPLIADFFIVRVLWRKVAGKEAASNGDVASKLNLAAVGLLLAGIVNALTGLFWIGSNVSVLVGEMKQGAPLGEPVVMLLVSLGSILVVYYTIGSALFLMHRNDEGDITFPLLIAAVAPPGCLFGLPAAIYALVLLGRAEVKALFPKVKAEPEAGPLTAKVSGAKRQRWPLAGIAMLLVIGGALFWQSNESSQSRLRDLFATSTPRITAEQMGSKEPGQYRYRYQIHTPPDHRVVMWMETTRNGKPVVIPGLANNISTSTQLGIGERFDGDAEFSLMEGSRITPDSKGKWRWDFKHGTVGKNTHRISPGGWIDDPFAGMSTSIHQGPKSWELKPGEEVSILVIRGGNHSYSDPTVEPPAGEIELRLKARIDPVPLFHRVQGSVGSSLRDPFPTPATPLGRIAAGFRIDPNLPEDEIRRQMIAKLTSNDSKRLNAEMILKSVGKPVTRETKPEDVLKSLESVAETMK